MTLPSMDKAGNKNTRRNNVVATTVGPGIVQKVAKATQAGILGENAAQIGQLNLLDAILVLVAQQSHTAAEVKLRRTKAAGRENRRHEQDDETNYVYDLT